MAIAGVDHNGRILRTNAPFLSLFSSVVDRDAVDRRVRLDTVIHERDRAAFAAALAYGPAQSQDTVTIKLETYAGPRHAMNTQGWPQWIKQAEEASGGKLSGEKKYVADGHIADLFIVAGQEGALYLVKADAKGLTRRELVTVDSRGAADLAFDDVEAEPMNGGVEVLDQILDRARIGMAAEMLGQASEAFAITSEYLKTRRQFGQPIGGFQALQHRAAKLFTELELTRSCVLAALDALDRNDKRIGEFASLAKARACETLHLASNEMVQLHGGIGMTDEHDAGLYLKRARVAEALYGNASFHRDRYASLLGF